MQTRVCKAYHDVSNEQYDCWPLNATKTQNQVVPCDGNDSQSCLYTYINNILKKHCSSLGLHLDWTEPPRSVEKGQKFNVTYWAWAEEKFFQSSTTVFPGKR